MLRPLVAVVSTKVMSFFFAVAMEVNIQENSQALPRHVYLGLGCWLGAYCLYSLS
jgi:hypothetical protein